MVEQHGNWPQRPHQVHQTESNVRSWLSIVCLGFMTFIACDRDPDPEIETHELVLLNSFPLAVPEPSGLTLDGFGGFWTVSDQTAQLYHLGSQGEVIDVLDCDGTDLEGIAFDSLNQELLVVDEAAFLLYRLGLDGTEILRINLSAVGGDPSHGLEGLCVDESRIWILKEKAPGLLIQLSAGGMILSNQELDFADDYSGIDRDPSGDLWILSDESEMLAHCDASGILQTAYSLGFSKPEGLALDHARGRIWIVSDSQERLYEFQMP
jgi:uncharacterized protein YjiK